MRYRSEEGQRARGVEEEWKRRRGHLQLKVGRRSASSEESSVRCSGGQCSTAWYCSGAEAAGCGRFVVCVLCIEQQFFPQSIELTVGSVPRVCSTVIALAPHVEHFAARGYQRQPPLSFLRLPLPPQTTNKRPGGMGPRSAEIARWDHRSRSWKS